MGAPTPPPRTPQEARRQIASANYRLAEAKRRETVAEREYDTASRRLELRREALADARRERAQAEALVRALSSADGVRPDGASPA